MPDEVKARVLAGERITVEIIYPNGVAGNVLATGTGALNIGACRINPGEPVPGGGNGKANHGGRLGGEGGTSGERPKVEPHTAGRWPANLLTDGSPEVLAAFAAFGISKSPKLGRTYGRSSDNEVYTMEKGSNRFRQGAECSVTGYGDEGSPARFFYSAKASKAERAGSKHPTVKPVALMRWLCRMVTPPGGVVLDPFAGSGTTGEAALLEGFHPVLIEREAEYHADILARLARHVATAPLLAEAA